MKPTISLVREALTNGAGNGELAASLDGYVLVPREPRPDTLKAMADCYDPTWGYPDRSVADDWARDSYEALLAAAEGDK